MMRMLALAAMVAVVAPPTEAEEVDNGLATFFACVESIEWKQPTYLAYAQASPAQHCFDALEASVPGWCPLMDNQIRTQQGDGLYAAAAALLPPTGTITIDLDGIDWMIETNPDFGTTQGFADCPGVEDMSVPDGVSKQAICHQRAGWAVFAQIRFLMGARGTSQ
ncbi:MAG: hypothetical protein AAGF13_03500 [Pseudomonadota bacterium]